MLGILNHVDENSLIAKLYRSKRVQAYFPYNDKKMYGKKYHTLESGLRDIGYSIRKLSDEDSVGNHIIIW